MNICICACQFYQRTPREKIAAVQAACRVAQMPSATSATSCEIVPDLCYVAAKDRDRLTQLASCDFVLACQSRAVRSLLGNAGNAKCIDLRTEPLADILAALSLTPMEAPVPELTYHEQKTDWTPWFPVIDAERCTHCRKCVDFCMFGVYAIAHDKVCVIKPESCKTDCPACARVCPQNAIMFPKSEDERLNGSLAEPVKPYQGEIDRQSADDNLSFRERLKQRKGLRLFKEDAP